MFKRIHKIFGAIGFSVVIFFNTSLALAHIQNQLKSKRLIIIKYKNGKIKERGYQGYYEDQNISTGTAVGTWEYFDVHGKLIKSIYYHNDVPSKAFIEKTDYHPNGKVRSIEKFNNYELYESEKRSTGTWKYFNSSGKLIKTIVH